jgi:hypothetical protein
MASGGLHLQADDRRFADAQRAIAERLAVGSEPVAPEIEGITPRGRHLEWVAGEGEFDEQPLLAGFRILTPAATSPPDSALNCVPLPAIAWVWPTSSSAAHSLAVSVTKPRPSRNSASCSCVL